MFGNRLKELRKSKNLSQEKLAEILGASNNAVYNWEVGRSQPPIEIITKLAEYFNVTTDYLLGFSKDNLDEIEKLKIALKEAGMMVGDDLTMEELEKALKIVEMMKDNKKDTEN